MRRAYYSEESIALWDEHWKLHLVKEVICEDIPMGPDLPESPEADPYPQQQQFYDPAQQQQQHHHPQQGF